MDIIQRSTKERAARYYRDNPQIKNSVLDDNNKNRITCECGNFKFKLYKKHGGIVLGKRNKIIKDTPVTFTFVCKCGLRQVLKEDDFSYGKIKFGCKAGNCPYGKTKMDKDCLTCKYVFEK